MSHPRAKTERNAAVVRAIREGASYAQAAERFEISTRRVGQILRAEGIWLRGPRRSSHNRAQQHRPVQRPIQQLDPLLASLANKLPSKHQGMSRQEREDFVAAVEACFQVVYGPSS